MVSKAAVVGIDLGASDSYVAYISKGIVDVVQNEVSKRATPSLVGFTDRERLLGDPALSLIRSNAKNTCRNFKHLLGRKIDASDVQTEHFWSTCPLKAAEDGGFCGYDVTYKGERDVVSATKVTAMYLTKLKDITETWCQTKMADAVIAVPSSFSDVQRQALLDAAKISGVSVLRIMNEHTATALAYGIYRSNDFDPVKPLVVAFCSMGHSIFSVSIVQFIKGKLTVLCEKSDKVGGRNMDECLMRVFAGEFKKKFGCDPLSDKRASFKLEDAVAKTKKVLSANSEAGINVECLMEDEDFSSNMNRADFESMCQPMMERVQAVLDGAKADSQLTDGEIDLVEMVGGASRVPWVKKMVSDAFGGKELSFTMNQEESVARGCALQAAILSPLYKVRPFKVEDCSPFAVGISYQGGSAETNSNINEEGVGGNGDSHQASAGDGESKSVVVFPPNSMMDVQETMTFKRQQAFDIKAEFVDQTQLPLGTPKELGTFHIEMPPQTEAKQVQVLAKRTLHGTFNIESAKIVEEIEYEETVKEKRELPAEEHSPSPASPSPASPSDENQPAKEGVDDENAGLDKKENGAEQPKDDVPTSVQADVKDAEVKEEPEGDKEPPKKKSKKTKNNEDAANKTDDAAKKTDDAAENAEMKDTVETDAEKKDDAAAEADADKNPDAAAADEPPVKEANAENGENHEKKEPIPKKKREPRYEWVDVVKKKRRIKETPLTITTSGRPGLDAQTIQKRMDEETQMQVEMREIVERDEKMNDLESYIFNMRARTSEGDDLGEFISSTDREKFANDLTKAEDWCYDTPDATKVQFIDKINELKEVGEAVKSRFEEFSKRGEHIDALEKNIATYKASAEAPGDKYGHIAAEKLQKIVQECFGVDIWLGTMKADQEKKPKCEKPVLLCADIQKKDLELSTMAEEILQEPKPAPPVVKEEDKKEEKAEEQEQEQECDDEGEEEEMKDEPEAEVDVPTKSAEAPEGADGKTNGDVDHEQNGDVEMKDAKDSPAVDKPGEPARKEGEMNAPVEMEVD